MISEEQLNEYRLSGEKVRVVRDDIRDNDIRGIVIAWDDEHVLIRRPNRNVVKLSRSYIIQPSKEPRRSPFDELPTDAGVEQGELDASDQSTPPTK